MDRFVAYISLVSCCDKLHNARAILTDLRTHANKILIVLLQNRAKQFGITVVCRRCFLDGSNDLVQKSLQENSHLL